MKKSILALFAAVGILALRSYRTHCANKPKPAVTELYPQLFMNTKVFVMPESATMH